MGRLMDFCMPMGSILGEGVNYRIIDGRVDEEQLIQSVITSSLPQDLSLSTIDHIDPTIQSSLQSLHRRPRNRVAVKVVVNINQHTRISPLVESRRARTTTRNLRSTPTNQKVHTLRVILRPIIAPTRMQRNNLMPQHISARFQTARNRHRPRVVTRDQIVRSPSARGGAALEADLVDFGEF